MSKKKTSSVKRGASAQSWNQNNPRPILESMIEEFNGDPNDIESRRVLFDDFMRMIRKPGYEATLRSVIEYWYTNNYHALIRAKFKQKTLAEQREALMETRKGEARNRARILLLDMVMPSGNPLRDCTGEDCARAGGWFALIAEKVGPNDIVGHVLKENQLQGLFQSVNTLNRNRTRKRAA